MTNNTENWNNQNISSPLKIQQILILDTLLLSYSELKLIYEKFATKTRKKRLRLPKIYKTVNSKSNKFTAITYYNMLPTSFKTLSLSKKLLKNNIKNWVITL